MGHPSIAIRFQVFKGNQLVKDQVVSEPVIKIGKLASSQLRLDEETVSRMHAVIEVDGRGEPQLIDLGSTRGTTVNGDRVNKAALRSGDEVRFGDSRVVVTFAAQNDNAAATPPPVEVAVGPASWTAPVAEAGLEGDSKAIEVQSLYRGVVTHTRHLTDVAHGNADRRGKQLVVAGGVFVAAALAVFFSTVVSAGRERARYDRFLSEGHEARNFEWAPQSPALDFVVFASFAVGVSLVYSGLKRRSKTSPDFVIGADGKADAPVAEGFVGGRPFSLVSATGSDYLVNVTPSMSGEVQVGGRTLSLAQVVQDGGPSFSLGERGHARIDCGDTTFLIRATPAPRRMPTPLLAWRWDEQAYNVGTAATMLMFLLMVFSIPPDPKSLSLDLFNAQSIYLPGIIKPPVEKEEEIPPWLKKAESQASGGKGQRHKGDEGMMGKKTSKNKEGLYAIKGPKDNQDQYLAKKLAEENAKVSGILGVLRTAEGSHIASIFGRQTALGADTSDILGGLRGNDIGEAYGIGGFGVVGTGSGGGGVGQGTIGLDRFGTLGKGGGGGPNAGYGRGAGGLGGRRARGPEIIPGQATVNGSLDKEIIRRIIRRHINEVKFCYEGELTKKPGLEGRVSVQFSISAAGQVITSVLLSSTMQNVRVESCVVQAVRRWEFPRPERGGLVIVSYPFNFQSSGAGG